MCLEGIRRHIPVDVGNLGVQLVQLLLGSRDVLRGTRRVEARDAGGDGLDGVLELLHAVAFVGQQRDAERPDALGQLLLQDRQRRLALGRHQDALALREVVADDVGDGVGLAGSRRPLHDDPVVGMQLLNDGDLLIVVGHREVQLHRLRACIAGRQPAERLLGRTFTVESPRSTKLRMTLGSAWPPRPSSSGGGCPRERCRRSACDRTAPSVRNRELVARGRRRNVVRADFVGA
jgi:hypothetical protein